MPTTMRIKVVLRTMMLFKLSSQSLPFVVFFKNQARKKTLCIVIQIAESIENQSHNPIRLSPATNATTSCTE
jgi:hypothetical protein